MISRAFKLPEQAAKLAAQWHLSTKASKTLVKFAYTIEHSGGLAVGMEFISRATFHIPAGILASVVVVFGILIWQTGEE